MLSRKEWIHLQVVSAFQVAQEGSPAGRRRFHGLVWTNSHACPPCPLTTSRAFQSEMGGITSFHRHTHYLGSSAVTFPCSAFKKIQVSLCRISLVRFPAPPLPNGSLLSLILGIGPTNCNVVLNLLSLPFRYPLHAFHMVSCAASALSCRVIGPSAYWALTMSQAMLWAPFPVNSSNPPDNRWTRWLVISVVCREATETRHK